MRFAWGATLIAAIIAAPLVVRFTGPVDSALFVREARCAAYQTVLDEGPGRAGLQRARVNAEAQRQPLAATEVARAAVSAIAARAEHEDTSELRAERAVACMGGVL